MTTIILSLTLLNRETMDEDVVPAVASHLLHLGVHLKHLMSLIIVLKLLIKIIVSISSTSASVNVRKSHLKSYSIMTMTITTAGFIIVSTIAMVIFIVLTLLPMSLILVLKLAISRTESAISPVAKFCTT